MSENTKTIIRSNVNRPIFLLLVHTKGNVLNGNHKGFFLPQKKYDLKLKKIETEDLIIELFFSHQESIYFDSLDNILYILYGELFMSVGSPLNYIRDQYRKIGKKFISNLTGSFAIIIIDIRKNLILFFTDRINSRKLFFHEDKNGSFWVSNSLYISPLNKYTLDIKAIACFLVNGCIYNNRTLFKSVKIFNNASIYFFRKIGLSTEKYWNYSFNNINIKKKKNDYIRELSEILLKTKQNYLFDNPEIILSLSGGYDSTGILGLLTYGKQKLNIYCFSYGNRDIQKGSDAYVAKMTTNFLAIPHRIIPNYNGNFLELLKLNAKYGQGITSFCNELDSFIDIAKDIGISSDKTMLVGDECFGWLNTELNSRKDVLNEVMINDFSAISWFTKMLETNQYRDMEISLLNEINNILSQYNNVQNTSDLRDILYFNERLQHKILPLREYILGEFFNIRYPLLDNEILDLLKNVPPDLRNGKKLYRLTILNLFPELFKIRRSSFSYTQPNWRKEICNNRKEIETLVLNKSCSLDDLISVDSINHLLNLIEKPPLKKHNLIRNKLFKFQNVIPDFIQNLNVVKHSKNKLLNTVIPSFELDDIQLLKNILIIRLFLLLIEDKHEMVLSSDSDNI